MEPVQRAEHQENAEALHGELIIQPFLGAEQRNDAHRREPEDKETDHGDDFRRNNGNQKGFLHPRKILAAVVIPDHRLCADSNPDQNGKHDLIDFHGDTHRRDGNFRAVYRFRAILLEEIVEQNHDDRDGDLRDKAADAEREDVSAHLSAQAQRGQFKVQCFESGNVDDRNDEGHHLSHDRRNCGAADPHLETQR